MVAEKQSGLGLYSNFDDGEREWGAKFNHNHTTMSHITHPSVKFATPITAEPNQSLRTLGATFLVGPAASIASSSFRQYANSVVVWDDSQWYRYPNMQGMMVHAQDTGQLYLWNGTAWVGVGGEAAWEKRWLRDITQVPTSGSLVFQKSSSPIKIFDDSGRCISPGLYDIRFQIQTKQTSQSGADLNLQIMVGNNIIAESNNFIQGVMNSFNAKIVQGIAQINQQDMVTFNSATNNSSLLEAQSGQSKTFATVHRIR